MEELGASLESNADEAAAEENPEVVSRDTSTSPDDVTDAESESTAPAATDDDEEIDHDGEKFKVPKKLKDAFLRQQDYTQKTQAVAEQRKSVEAYQQEVQRQAQAQQANIAEYAEAYSLDAQLKQFQGVDWGALIDSDPVQAMKLQHQMNSLKARRDEVVASVTHKQQTQHQESQRATAKRLEDGRAVLAREIKNWSPETAKSLSSYGREFGFTDDELAQVSDPRSVKLLHKAWQFDQLMKKQATPKEKPAPQVAPVTRITASKGTATKDPAKMTDSEFAAMRKRQIAQRSN